MNRRFTKTIRLRTEKGFSLPELLVVLFIIAIVVVLALPQLISSRRLLRFAGVQREIVSTLRQTRQEAMSQRSSITFRYDNLNKRILVYGGTFGALGSPQNQTTSIADWGLLPDEIVYGRPPMASPAALGDGTNFQTLVGDAREIAFRGDGSVVDGAGNPVDSTLYFYDVHSNGTAFAVSVLGAGGRVKIWRYVESSGVYVE